MATDEQMESHSADQHIVFLDDDVKVLKSINRILVQKRVGWEYSFATCVSEARDLMSKRGVDMLISDIKMPGTDGFHFLKSLRESSEWHDLPVVMVTGIESPRIKTKAIELGAADLLSKPIRPEELLARIHAVLHQKRRLDGFKAHNDYLKEVVSENSREAESSKIEMILRLAKATEFRSSEYGNHFIRVGYFAKILSKRLGVDRTFSDNLFITSPLHDIGNIALPDSILHHNNKLSEKEWAIMKTHCELGYDLLSPCLFRDRAPNLNLSEMVSAVFGLCETSRNHLLDMAAAIALAHHEWFDGTGYPYGRRGEQIPLAARIVAIADTYDELRTEKPYKSAQSHAKSLAIMQELSGKQFDPNIFEVFQQCSEDFKRIYLLEPFAKSKSQDVKI